MEKTDLKKILSVSGEHGLYEYVAQGRNGMIAQSLITGQRKLFGPSAKVSSLSDISIYTTEEELPLKQVLRKLADNLSNGPAMSSKEDTKKIQSFFGEVIPDYDADRFYVSHMKKVLDWYNCLQQYASVEFVDDDEPRESESAEVVDEVKAE